MTRRPASAIVDGARTLWTVARGHNLYASTALITLGCLTQAFGPSTFPVPNLVSPTDIQVSVTGVASLLIGIGIAQLCAEPIVQLARVAPRPWFTTRVARLAIGLVAGLAAAALTAPTGYAQASLSGCLTFAAEAFVMARLAGVRTSWLLPTAHLLAGMTFGSRGDGNAQPWAWFLTFHPSATQHVLVSAAALTTLVAWASHYPNPDNAEAP